MRFCFVLPEFDENRNSFSKLVAPVVDELLAKKHEVTLLSANRAYNGKYRSRHIVLSLPDFKLGFINYFLFLVLSTFWLRKNRRKFDVIHNLGVGTTLCQNIMTAHACHRAWVSTKIQLGQYWSLVFNPLHALVLMVESINYRRKIPVIAVCESLANQIKLYYPKAAERIVVIPNGAPKPKEALEPDFDSKIISFASNDHGKKGLGELLDSLAIAKAAGKIWTLHIIGQDKNQVYWERVVTKKGLAKQVRFLGHVNDIQKHMAQSALFCLPSYYESFGLVYLEAAQISCPIVGTRVGVYPDLVGEDFPMLPLDIPLSSQKLFEVLDRILTDRDFAMALGARAQSVAKRYTQESMVEKTMAVYTDSSFV